MVEKVLEISTCIFLLSISTVVAVFATGIVIQLIQDIKDNR